MNYVNDFCNKTNETETLKQTIPKLQLFILIGNSIGSHLLLDMELFIT